MCAILVVAGFAVPSPVSDPGAEAPPALRAPGRRGGSAPALSARSVSRTMRSRGPNHTGSSASIRALSKRPDRYPYKASRPELYATAPLQAADADGTRVAQPITRSPAGAPRMPDPTVAADGIAGTGYLPPDTTGDVGPDHYVQAVNIHLAIYDKAGTLLTDTSLTSLWSGLPGTDAVCENWGAGDPIVLYDQIADRWLISQFAFFDLGAGNDYHQCFAISKTPDPTGEYHLYDYTISTTALNDYPKIGVWPDGYYVAINQFDEDTLAFVGAAALVFDRQTMLGGGAADYVVADLGSDLSIHSLLPSDLDGAIPPPLGSPNYYLGLRDGGAGQDKLRLFEFSVDWGNTANSSFVETSQLSVNSFSGSISCGDPDAQCITQPGTSERLDHLSDRLMYRLAYRNFGSHESMVVNHTINDGSGVAVIRWYEIRDPASGPTSPAYQTTLNPGDGVHRWMGSAAMDGQGNVALGYSVSDGTSVYPGIRYQGWEADGSSYTMDTETLMVAGGGAQTNANGRWGDYSSMSVDPADECTFWFTSEYMAANSTWNWSTKIGAFRFPGCVSALPGSLSGTVLDAVTGTPVVGATVRVGAYSATTTTSGYYSFPGLPDGTYALTVKQSPTHVPASVQGVTVTEGDGGTVNVSLRSVTARDFNGDGYEDVVIGTPGEAVNGRAGAGAVHVLYGSASGPTAAGDELLTQDTPGIGDRAEAGDAFGSSFAAGDFNRDGYSDLAVGIPGEDVGSRKDAGAVAVFFGGAAGLIRSDGLVVGDLLLRQGAGGVAGTAEAGDRFGSSLAAGDLNGDGYADLAVGVPGEGIGSRAAAGGVAVLYGSASGPSGSSDQFWHQDSGSGATAIADRAESGDRYGAAVAIGNFNADRYDDIAVGVPGEDLGTRRDAGAVSILYGTSRRVRGTSDQFWSQDSAGVNGTAAAGDAFGSALATGDFDKRRGDDLAVGIPGENAGGDADSGAVAVLYSAGSSGLRSAGDQLWNQDSPGIGGTTQRGDRFGSALAAGNFDGLRGEDLAIGVPGDYGTYGAAAVLYSAGSSGLGASGNDLWTQASAAVFGGRKAGDRFGAAVGVAYAKGGSRAFLYVGAPGDDIGSRTDAGTVSGLQGHATGLVTSGAMLWHQNAYLNGHVNDRADRGDRFGSAIG